MPSLEDDWERLRAAVLKVKNAHWNSIIKIFFGPEELRKADNRGIDFVIRRLTASKKYGHLVRLYGGPPHLMPRNPFRVEGRVYQLLGLNIDEVNTCQK